MSKIFILNVLAIVTGILSMVTCLSLIFNNRTTFSFGQSTGLAPMPLPFRELRPGSENINVSFSIALTKDNITSVHSQNEIMELLSLHDRPHRAAIPFYTVSNYFPVIPDKIKKNVYLKVCYLLGGDAMTVHLVYEGVKYNYNIVCKK